MKSHLDRLIEVFRKSQHFYVVLSPRPRNVSEDVRSTDCTDPSAIPATLSRHASLLSNMQSKFAGFMGDLEACLRQFDILAIEADLPARFARVGAVRSAHENASPRQFDPALIESPERVRFLAERSALDAALPSGTCDASG